MHTYTLRGDRNWGRDGCEIFKIHVHAKTSQLMDEFLGRDANDGIFYEDNSFIITGEKFQQAWNQTNQRLIDWWNETLNIIDLENDREDVVFVGGPAIFPWHLLPSNIKYRPVIGQLKPISWSPKSISYSNPNYNTATLWTHGDVNPNFGASDDHEKFIGTDEFKEYAEALRNRHFGAPSQVIEDANEVSFVCQNPINKDVSKGISLWYHSGHGDARFGLDFKTKSLSIGDISDLLDVENASIDLAWVMSCHSIEIFTKKGWSSDDDGDYETIPLIQNNRIGALLGIIGVGDDSPESFFACCEIYRHLNHKEENIARALYLTRRFLDPLGHAIAQITLIGDPEIKVPQADKHDFRQVIQLMEENHSIK